MVNPDARDPDIMRNSNKGHKKGGRKQELRVATITANIIWRVQYSKSRKHLIRPYTVGTLHPKP